MYTIPMFDKLYKKEFQFDFMQFFIGSNLFYRGGIVGVWKEILIENIEG